MNSLVYPAIPNPASTVDSLLETTRALKEAVELLNGARGSLGNAKALTADDLTYVFGASVPAVPGTPPPPTGPPSGVTAAIAAARAAAQLALLELRNALENASNDLNNSQETALAEFQILLDAEEAARIDGDALIQTQVDAIILTNDEGAIAGIATEAALRVAADDALAGQIETVQAGVDGNTAAITSEAVARAAEDEALAIQINSITAIASGQHTFVQTTPPVGTVGAPLTVGDIWLDTAHGNLMKVWDGSAWTDRQDAQIDINAAAIISEQTVRADTDTAIAQDITNLTAAVDDGFSTINDELIVLADADTAIAGQITTIQTSVASNSTAITNEALARADADGALANQIESIEANAGGNAQALVEEEAIARAAADSALADDIELVSTTVDGHTSTITEHATSIDGLMAEYSVVLNANGHIAGFEINAGGSVSEFIVQADKFKIVSATNTGLANPFTVIGANTFINRVIVNDEIKSVNYAVDGSGIPTLGYRAGSDGLLRAYDARFSNMQSVGGTFDTGTFINLTAMDAAFVDFAARGGTFTERPVLLATPNFRNGVPDNLATGWWASPGNIQWSSGSAWLGMQAQRFHRTPETYFAQFVQIVDAAAGDDVVCNQSVFVPPGQRLPPVIVGDRPGEADVVEWRGDGTIVRIAYNGNGGIASQSTALGWWMYDVEIDPLNLAGKTKMYAGLGFSRYPQPLRVPVCSTISFKVWGAGGGKDDGGSIGGGPGGYASASFTVGTRTSAALIKQGDMLWLLPGEGGKSKSQDVIMGFGGRGQAQERRASGGGLSGVFINVITRANALVIAGGGGGAEGGQKGAGGGPVSATTGGNGVVSGTDDAFMTGLPWTYDGSNQKAAGGGGYVGGGWLTASGGNAGGRGGTNFVHASATTSTSPAASTTTTPPNSSDLDYVARRYCLGNLADVGEGKTNNAVLETGGNGLIVVSFA